VCGTQEATPGDKQLVGYVSRIEHGEDLPQDLPVIDRQCLEPLSSEERLTVLLEQMKLAGTLPLDVDPSQVRRLVHVVDCNDDALEHYALRTYSGSITLLQAGKPLYEGLVLAENSGWRDLAGGLTVHTFPSNHFDLMREPVIQMVAAQLHTHLRRLEDMDSEDL
jgi:hypothetical protein